MSNDIGWKIPVSDIYVDWKANTRGTINKDDVENTAESLMRVGIINPVTLQNSDPEVTSKPYTLVAGYTRFKAATEILHWTEIPATLTDQDPFQVSVEENLKRSNLSMYQEAVLLKRWMEEENLSYRKVGARLGVSVNWIQSRLELLNLDAETQRLADGPKGSITQKEVLKRAEAKRPPLYQPAPQAAPQAAPRAVPQKKTSRVRTNAEISDLINALVDKLGFGSDAGLALGWTIGQVDDAQIKDYFGVEIE